MFRILGIATFAAVLMTAWLASAQEVVRVKRSLLPVYDNSRGAGESQTLSRKDLRLPAAVISNVSPKGFLQVEFRFKDDRKKIVWVRKRDVTLSDRKTLDVRSCKSPGLAAAMVSRGSRGLGDGC